MIKSVRFFLIFVFLTTTFVGFAQDIPEPINPPRMVNDFANIFSADELKDLELTLRNYNDTTSTQIYVVTINDLEGYAISDYAFRLGEKWKIGQKSKDNGAVILIKPKRGNSRGNVFIAVGYGLEEKLNDAKIGRIIDNYMLPYFQEDNYYMGTKMAVSAIIQYLSGQFQADPNEEHTNTADIIIAILILLVFLYLMGKSGGNGNHGSSGRRSFFPPMSGGGFGGSSGGGFSGGGGGSFGGGGAGRSW